MLQILTLTALALIGPFAINTFLGVLAESALGIGGDRLALVLAFFGVVSFAGSQFGGYAPTAGRASGSWLRSSSSSSSPSR